MLVIYGDYRFLLVYVLPAATQELLDQQAREVEAQLQAKEEEMRKLEEVRQMLQSSQR